MAIQVVCRGCKKRFQVDDVHAGKTGPCPNCQESIQIPRPEDEVIVHEPENLGPDDSSGRPVLKPIPRTDAKLSRVQWILISVGLLLVLVAAITIRIIVPNPQEHAVLLIGAGSLLLGFPLSIMAYTVLRDDERDPYRGKSLILRNLLCTLIYASIWAAYPGISNLLGAEGEIVVWHTLFVLMPICCIAAIAPFAALDLDYMFGLIHCGFFVVITALLGYIIKLPLYI